MSSNTYRHYFDIDPEYFPVVDENVIRDNPDLWKKYYPHKTFVDLLKTTIKALNRTQKLSIWVEGAYGSGKSHSVLTLKKLLDADEADTAAYFDKYSKELGNDLKNSFLSAKRGGKILTVHRYGSSDIHNDQDMVFAIQNSIAEALKSAGLSGGESSLKNGVIRWLSDEDNRKYFDSIIHKDYSNVFAGDTADSLLQKLQTYTDDKAIRDLMRKITTAAHEKGIIAMDLQVSDAYEWIKKIIRENQLKALFFIWDEFTDYFENVKGALSGFQGFAQLTATDPFYLVIVTHKSSALFAQGNKILDRFVTPINIDLPENMAFLLTGAALEKNPDPNVRSEWKQIADELYDTTKTSRTLIKQRAGINDQELEGVLPIHPYTALMLKHMSTAFKSSGLRSMFDFIKNDRGNDVFSFQWFINNHGPIANDPLLTADMLWEYFYVDGHEGLSAQVLSVLDRINQPGVNQLDNNEKRVLKTVLLLQALGINVGDSVEVFKPNKTNLANAFEGSSIIPSKAIQIADKLVQDHILIEKSVGNKQFVYNVPVGETDITKITEIKERLRKETSTARILEASNGYIPKLVTLTGFLDLRYQQCYAGVTNFHNMLNQQKKQAYANENRIQLITVYARDDAESSPLKNFIQNTLADSTNRIIFLDASLTSMGQDLFEQYIDACANVEYQQPLNKSEAQNYQKIADNVLKKWREKLENGSFDLYTPENPSGERLTTVNAVLAALRNYDISCFPQSPESMGSVLDTMWVSNSLGLGASCGIDRETKATFKSSNEKTKLENLLGDAWKLDRYWEEKPHLPISRIKIEIEKQIQKDFEEKGRFAVRDIFDLLAVKPYGMFTCNLTSFLLGFLLREYADSRYTWSDGVTSVMMSKEKLKDVIVEVLNNAKVSTGKVKTKYIVTMTEEERAFHTLSAEAFRIDKDRCSSVEETRKLVRKQMEGLYFPLWCVNYKLPAGSTKTASSVITEVISLYQGLANTENIAGGSSEADIAQRIGKLRLANPYLSEDLRAIITRPRCQEGMDAYLHDYRDGELITLAGQIGDGGQYINCIRNKFDAQAANWVWHQDTVNQKIDEVIRDYKIIRESNDILPKSTNFSGVLSEWQDKLKYIRLSFKAIQNSLDALETFCRMLYELKKTGVLPEGKRDDFLNELKQQKEAFRVFSADPVSMFKQACGYYLYGLSDEDIKAIYVQMPLNCYTQDKSDYLKSVENTVNTYRANQAVVRMRKYWLDKTGTNSPEEWSDKYSMPILAMANSSEYEKARKAFDTLNRKNPDNDAMEFTQAFMEKTSIFERLKDPEERDKAFREKIIENRDVLLDNIDEVKSELKKRVSIPPYSWLSHWSVRDCLDQMCSAKYAVSGYDKAVETINEMDPIDVKRYLKELLKDNMVVGMEIIRSRKK